jgi:hypothetical protein
MRTSYKSKLPKDLAHPIGLQALIQVLSEAPNGEVLTVGFSRAAVWPDSRFRSILKDLTPYPILVASHCPASKPNIGTPNRFIETGDFNEKWDLRVNSVLREHKSQANALLLREGLPALVAWLGKARRTSPLLRTERLELIFVPREGRMRAEESTNPSTI